MLKRFFQVTVAFLTLSQAVNAQETRLDYRPLLEDGKEWHYTYYYRWDMDAMETRFVCEHIDGDTIVGGVRYFKLYRHYEDDGAGSFGEKPELWREENYKVYTVRPNTGEEELMYDFDVSAGANTPFNYVCSIDTIYTHDAYYRRFRLDRNLMWVEGVGSNWTLSYPYGVLTTTDFHATLLECRKNGEVIFTLDDFSLPANTAAGTHFPENHKTLTDCRLFDLQGHRLKSPTRPGLYIRDGRKVVVR